MKLPKPRAGGAIKKINHSLAQWQRGYIRKRLTQKCAEQSVEIVEVLGKGISNECSVCGAIGMKSDGMFRCPACGYLEEEKMNTARNVKNEGRETVCCFKCWCWKRLSICILFYNFGHKNSHLDKQR